MKPHPRIRKTIKWGGAVVTVLMVGVWRWNERNGIEWVLPSRAWIGVWGHSIWLGRYHANATGIPYGVHWMGELRGIPEWWYTSGMSAQAWALTIPLSWPTVACLMITAAAWAAELLARHRARLDLCPTCRYPRTGLPVNAPCPECGGAGSPGASRRSDLRPCDLRPWRVPMVIALILATCQCMVVIYMDRVSHGFEQLLLLSSAAIGVVTGIVSASVSSAGLLFHRRSDPPGVGECLRQIVWRATISGAVAFVACLVSAFFLEIACFGW